MPNEVAVNVDAFSSGQISSKIWLCNQLEKITFSKHQTIWVYGGWYGMASFLLLSRQTVPVTCIRSYDVDPSCEHIADSLLENWIWQDWKFKAITADCNCIQFDHNLPDIIINCSTEHFHSAEWFSNIPSGTLLVLQSNNMPHVDHHSCFDTLDDFANAYPLDSVIYKGQLDFSYPTWEFSRFMLIGHKK